MYNQFKALRQASTIETDSLKPWQPLQEKKNIETDLLHIKKL